MAAEAMPKQKDWTKPAAMAIPKGGYFEDKIEQGRYGPIFPQTPACYGFSVIAKLKPGGEAHLYNHAKVIEKGIADDPTLLAPLKAHYLRWVIFTIKGDSYMMYQGIFDTDFDNTARMPPSSSGSRALSRHLRPSRAGRRTTRQILRLLSNSFASTSAQASWNTVNIPT
jgi:hypothetical protein